MGYMTDFLLIDVPEATTRRCGRCGETRPRAMFYEASEAKRAEREGRRHFRRPCRVCQREINRANQADRRAMLDKIKTEAGCMDCGLKDVEHPEIYDFDHRPEEVKVQGVAIFVTKGTVENMLQEVQKCDVVCANCHRIRTRARGFDFRMPTQ